MGAVGRVGLIGLIGLTLSTSRVAAESIQALPACTQKFARPPAAWPCSHGCEDWTSGGLTIRRISGTWGEASFADALEQQRACVLNRDFVTIVLVRDTKPRRVVVWPVRGGRPSKDTTSVLEITWTTSAGQRADAVLGSIELD